VTCDVAVEREGVGGLDQQFLVDETMEKMVVLTV